MVSRGQKKGLSLERHQEIGDLLKQMRADAVNLSIEFDNAYPVTGPRSRPARAVDKVIAALDQAKCWAEENLAAEYPDQWETSTYYGPHSGEDTARTE